MSYLLTEAKLNFELRDKIGNGGEGEVYKAYDKQLNALIAVKKVEIANFTDINRYFDESKKLYLTRHHHVVSVNYGCQDDDYIYLAMPYYKNGSIRGLMDKRFLTSREIIRYSLQFLSGLNNVHTKDLIHFDVKTENILISDGNQALLSDFGLAQYTSHYGFSPVLGTTRVYAPPEFFAQALHTLAFDIYQAGLAMYRMCNGDANFEHQIQNALTVKGVRDDQNFINAVTKGNFPDRRGYLPHIPKALAKVINNALKVSVDERYDSVIDILNDLSRIETSNDWLYTVDSLGNENWTYEGYVVTATNNNGSSNIEATKNGRRNTSYCKIGLNETEEKNLLQACLNTDW